MTLQDFLNNNVVEGVTKEVAISERFKDENGNILKFKIKPISQKALNTMRNKHTKQNGNKIVVDSSALSNELIINCTIEPNFKDTKSLEQIGVFSPEDYLNKVLLAGEINNLEKAILELSGFGQNIDELIEEAKN